jgi:hypothetical protein
MVRRAFGPLDATAALDAVTRMSDAQLEADRAKAHEVSRRISRDATARPSLSFGVFELVILAHRLSPEARWSMRFVRREAIAQGHDSIGALFDHLLAEHDAQA